jgi:hypothetical protein
MGLFNSSKPQKNNEQNEMFARLNASIFPKGDKDENACVDELLRILGNKISRTDAKSILLKSFAPVGASLKSSLQSSPLLGF